MIDPKTILSCFSSEKTLLETLHEIRDYLVEFDKIKTVTQTYTMEKDVMTKFVKRESGEAKIVAYASGNNYIDFYNADGVKVGQYTFNLSQNDILFITYANGGKTVSFTKLHDGGAPATKLYNYTTPLEYMVATSNNVMLTLA